MKPSTIDKTQGKLHEVKGKIKETVGKITNDPDANKLLHYEYRKGWSL